MKRAKLNKYQTLIKKFIRDPDFIWSSVKLIKREIAIAKKLYSLGDENFWNKASLSFKLNSLAWLLTEKGKEFILIEKKKQKLSVVKNETHALRKQKLGEDKKIDHKPKNVLEFCRDYAKEKEKRS